MIKISWNITISSDECKEHPDYRKDWKTLCNLVGLCEYDRCPKISVNGIK